MTARRWLLLAAMGGLASGFACSYDPHFESGVTKCADAVGGKRCPDGFVCDAPAGSPGVCVTAMSDGDAGTDAGTPGSGGSGGHSGVGGGAAGTGGALGTGGVTGAGTGGGTGTGGGKSTGTGGTAGTGTGGVGSGGHIGGSGGVGVGGSGGVGVGGAGVGGGIGGHIGVGGSGVGGSTSGAITIYPLAAATHPLRITVGPDGNLWFVETEASKIGRITPTASPMITEFSTKTAASAPEDIVSGPGAYVWFIESVGNLGRADMTGAITEFSFPAGTGPFSIATGPDGNLWYTDYDSDNIGLQTPAGSGMQWHVAGTGPIDIIAGPDGNLWSTAYGSNQIWKITPTGTNTFYSLPTSNAFPLDITSDKATYLWFLEIEKVGRVTAATGAIQEYTSPETNSSGAHITLGPGGDLWFTNGANKIVQFSPAGTVVNDYTVAGGSNASVTGIVAGPDGNIWFTDVLQNNIGKLVP